MSTFDEMGDCPRVFYFQDHSSRLRAVLCVDDTTLGPAAGGIRTGHYESAAAALQEARRLSRAMTLKCALAGLDAGGAKTVVLKQEGMDRAQAFEVLGRFIEDLGGLYRCAGDLGTTADDLAHAAKGCSYVHQNTSDLAMSVARGTLRCMEAIAEYRGRALDELSVGIQGCGAIGHSLATVLAERGCSLVVSDLKAHHAQETAEATGARVVDPAAVLVEDVDILAPCATGGVIGPDVAHRMKAWALCGAANNIVSGERAIQVLHEREVVHVPDVLASAGAVIDGIGDTVMGLPDRRPLIDRLRETATELLVESRESGRTTHELALKRARARIQSAKAANL